MERPETPILLDSIRRAHELNLSRGDPTESFQILLASLVELTNSEFGFLDEVLWDETGKPFKRSLALTDLAWDQTSRDDYDQLTRGGLTFLDLGNLAGAPVLERETVISNGLEHDPRSRGVPHGHPQIRSFMGLPLFFGTDLVGVAGIANRQGGYDEELAQWLSPFLSTCASVIAATRRAGREAEHVGALERANNLALGILNASTESSFLVDPQGKVLLANEITSKRLGLAADELLGRNIFDLLPEEVARSRRGFMEEAIRTRTPVEFEDVRDDVYFRHRIHPVLGPDGKVEKLALFGEDQTQRRGFEAELRRSREELLESNQLLSAILQNTHMMAVYLDPEFNFAWVNQAYTDTCGYPPSFFPGKNHFDLYPHQENQEIFRRVVESGEPFRVEAKAFEFPDQPERGTTYWDWSLIPVEGGDEKVIGLVFTLADVTRRIRAELELEESRDRLRELTIRLDTLRDEERAKLARELHDEVGQALAAMRMDLEKLEEELPDGQGSLSSRIHSMIDLAEDSVDRVNFIVSDLRSPVLEMIGLKAAVETEVWEYGERWGANITLDEDLGDIEESRERDTVVVRVLKEALVNVRRHAKADLVEVRIHREDGALVLTVRDDGIGISEDTVGSPSSYGLMGMMERVERIGGHLVVQPLGEKGTQVCASFPLETDGSNEP